MKNTLNHIITSIVDKPEAVEIQEETIDTTVTLTITVAPEDTGKVIGKSGKVIRAIRNVMKIPAMKKGKRVSVSLNG